MARKGRECRRAPVGSRRAFSSHGHRLPSGRGVDGFVPFLGSARGEPALTSPPRTYHVLVFVFAHAAISPMSGGTRPRRAPHASSGIERESPTFGRGSLMGK